MRALIVILPALVLAMALIAAYRLGSASGAKRAARLADHEELLDRLLIQCAQHAALDEPFAVVVSDEILTFKNNLGRTT